jgi:hypothetical protein
MAPPLAWDGTHDNILAADPLRSPRHSRRRLYDRDDEDQRDSAAIGARVDDQAAYHRASLTPRGRHRSGAAR